MAESPVLGQFVEITSSKRIKRADYVTAGIPFYRSKEVIERAKGNKITTELFITEEQFSGIQSKFGAPERGDILLTSVGTLGVSWQVKEDSTFYFKDGNLTWFRNFGSKLDSTYLLYWLRSSVGQRELERVSIGSTQRALTIVALKSLPFTPPALKDQKAIAHILGTLDDKIELNQKMNETLEEIAKAIFKSWFVDFDPVRAKMAGRSTGLSDDISGLFSDKLVDSEIGEIPEGWVSRELGEHVIPKKGKTITKKKTVEGEVPVVAGGLEPAYFHNQSNVDAPVTAISASGANAGFVRIYFQDIWASDCSYISREQTDVPYFWYVFLKSNQEKIYHMQQGAAQPHIYPSDLMRLIAILPNDLKLQKSFEELVTPFFDKTSISQREMRILSDLRDTLLPKLISGRLRIPDAEKFLSKAGV